MNPGYAYPCRGSWARIYEAAFRYAEADSEDDKAYHCAKSGLRNAVDERVERKVRLILVLCDLKPRRKRVVVPGQLDLLGNMMQETVQTRGR